VPFPRRPHGDLDILAEGGEELHEPLEGERARTTAHERRDMRLLDAEDVARPRLRQPALLDETVDLQREIGLELLAFGIREPEVAKDVAAAFLHPDPRRLPGHHEVCLSR